MHRKTIRLVHETLRENVAERPDKVALICDEQRLTYAQINEMANRLANALCDNGVQRGDRVVVFLPNSVELAVSVFATLKANAVFSVIDYATKFEKLRYIAADCEATALITCDNQAETATRLLHDIASLRFVILTGQNAPKQAKQTSNLLAFDTIQEDHPPVPPPQKTIDSDLAYLIYTSGSTGQPKGVMITHRSSLFAIQLDIDYLSLTVSDVIIDAMPLSFGYGFHQLLKSFRVGGTLVLEQSFAYPAMILKRMETERVTGFPGVPTTFAVLLRMNLDRYDLSHLRYLSNMGAPLAPSLIRKIRQKFPHALFFSMYSLTEACNPVGLDPVQLNKRPTSVGKPLPGTEVWLVDEKGQRIGPNQIGELVVRGGHVRCGYWNDPQTSARRFRPVPLPGEFVCHTSDLFRMDEEGYLYFVGRSDEVIKSGSRKVSPKEVENALYSLNGVLEAAAVGVPDQVLGQVINAFVVLDEHVQPPLTKEGILQHCHQTLEEYMIPREVEIRDSLPKTASGKIKKINLA
jgi:amino acid adenylation domain-containing protein